MSQTRGKFITVEGTEGVGKSTNIAVIKRTLEAKGIELIVTREPGGTPLAEELREIVLANRDENFHSLTELLIIFAARAQHIHEVILPAINAGKWVLSDRFTDATFAYQGYGRELPIAVIEQLEAMVQDDLHPDVTFLLDIDVEAGLSRAKARGELDRFEHEAVMFFEKVRSGYKERVSQMPERFQVIDASQSLEKVQADIVTAIETLFS